MSQHERTVFDAAELAVVLSYYDLGVIESITEFARGSRQSPKVGIVSEHGKYLLKRRAPSKANLDRVRFAHRLQAHLVAGGFPAARLIPTRERGETLVHLRDQVYELFEFIAGQPYTHTVEEAQDAGVVLARFHQAASDFVTPPARPVPRGDYHDAPGVRTGLCAIGSTLRSHDSFTGDEAALATLIQSLLSVYDQAVDAVNAFGFSAWPERVVHADWHPGNLLFRKQRIVAVVDYDAVRRSRRVIDVANGALQFSMAGSGDPAGWPDEIDEQRYGGFLAAYESLLPLDEAERGSLPRLMVQALIAECVPPIHETGSVGPWAGFRVLQMVRRKLAWLTANAERLTRPPSSPATQNQSKLKMS